jgi:hypothetical protein
MRPTFDIPRLEERDRQTLYGADRDWYYRQEEVPGPTYQIELSDQRQEGDPQRHPHGVPADLPPSKVQIIDDSVRALPVTQRIPRFPEKSRRREFTQGEDEEDDGLTDFERGDARALQQVIDMGHMHRDYGLTPEVGLGPWVYNPRQKQGRRYRPTFNGDDEANIPYRPAPAPADMPWIKFVRGW